MYSSLTGSHCCLVRMIIRESHSDYDIIVITNSVHDNIIIVITKNVHVWLTSILDHKNLTQKELCLAVSFADLMSSQSTPQCSPVLLNFPYMYKWQLHTRLAPAIHRYSLLKSWHPHRMITPSIKYSVIVLQIQKRATKTVRGWISLSASGPPALWF